MTKLPASMHAQLANALSKGAIPEHGEPGYDAFFDVFGEFAATLWEDATNPNAPPIRRHVAALIAIWSAIPPDGVLVGVACNQPEVVPVAIEAAESLQLPAVVAGLRAIADCIPNDVVAMPDPSERLDWYGSTEGEKAASRLEALYDELTEDEALTNTLMLTCMQQTLAHPTEFFEG